MEHKIDNEKLAADIFLKIKNGEYKAMIDLFNGGHIFINVPIGDIDTMEEYNKLMEKYWVKDES